ncbi:MAG: methionine--tRNA ligase [Alphaproteobacteria bacterium]|nr:methionine--tRNA ligase [Alphaproteobacteria bacterium]
MTKKKYLITSALTYINGLPHIGHLAGAMLNADIYARFLRAKGEDVLFVGGTDVHGTKIEVAAQQEGLSIKEYIQKYHDAHTKIYEGFNLSFDAYGHTDSEANKELTYRIFNGLEKNDFILEKTTKRPFCPDDNQFLADSQVGGTCPYCGYEKAKGDQCENCTKLLEPEELKNPYSTVSGSHNIVFQETNNLFIRLDKMQEQITQWIESKKGIWTDIAYTTAKKWLKEGLQPRAITRDLKNGFAVPKPGYDDKVFYCWFDAPIGYIGITKEWADKDPANRHWEDWWLNPDEVTHTEFIGKDNIPFHAIFFPGMLFGSKENWTQVSFLKATSWLNFIGGKISKSEHRGVFLDEALEEFPADYWRYWIPANSPESDDSFFGFDSFQSVINKDLNDVLGNFVNRVLKMTQANFGDVIPSPGPITDKEKELYNTLDDLIHKYTEQMDAIEFRKSLALLREIWTTGNNYIAQTEPWKVVKENKEYAATILYTALNLIRLFAHLSSPVMPTTAAKMLSIFGKETTFSWPTDTAENLLKTLQAGDRFQTIDPLFRKILDEEKEALKQKHHEGV